MQRDCEYCGEAFSRPPSQLGQFCSARCAYAARRKTVTAYRRMRYLPTHPLAGSTGLVSDARVVLYEKVGPGWHRCHWCEARIRWVVGTRGNARDSLIADHVDSNPLNDDPANLVPSCGPCNGSRARVIKPSEDYVVRKDGSKTRATRRICLICGSQFLVATAQLRTPGTGLCCSRSCARRLPRANSRPLSS